MSDDLTAINNLTLELFEKLGISDPKLEVTLGEDDLINIHLDIPEEESGLLIGFHGENIFAFQLLISQLIHKHTSQWRRVVVDIGDYRQKRQEKIENLAAAAAQKAKLTHQPVTLPRLNGSERRIVHLLLSDDQEVETFSQGEGRERTLIIKPL